MFAARDWRTRKYEALGGSPHPLKEARQRRPGMTTWTLVIFVYYGSGMMIQSSITGYSSYAECNTAGSNWMKSDKNKLKEYHCVSLKIKSGPRR
jgi:hypothetical protein